jgi:hypothetical protein
MPLRTNVGVSRKVADNNYGSRGPRHRCGNVNATEKSILKTAREKLNELNVVGALGAAGVVGLLCGSWTVFIVAGALLIAAGSKTGDIRLRKSKRR